VLIEGGVDYLQSVFFPLSGLEGNLLRVPTVGVSIGIGSIAELQIDGMIYERLSVDTREPAPLSHRLDFTGDETHDFGDMVIATKIRFVSEGPGRPAMGVRVATRLPNASLESGLGPDTTDFFGSFLLGKTVQSIRIVGNVGFGILAKPAAAAGEGQDDGVIYGLSLARAVRQGVEIVGEVNGLWNPREEPSVGLESRSNFRVGGRVTQGTVRIDGGLIVGLTSRDPSIGFTGGFTWVFRGFTVP